MKPLKQRLIEVSDHPQNAYNDYVHKDYVGEDWENVVSISDAMDTFKEWEGDVKMSHLPFVAGVLIFVAGLFVGVLASLAGMSLAFLMN